MLKQRLLYLANRRYTPQSADWNAYLAWSQLHWIEELVTLDATLCPRLITQLSAADWNYNATEEGEPHFFWDLDYLASRTPSGTNHQILATLKNPRALEPLPDKSFQFSGIDLVEKGGGTSTIVNCGGYDNTFDRSECNKFGLITDLARAQEIQRTLPINNPEDPHASSDCWA
ncbi:MAG: hypothetical protein IT290_03250, partial [Deltaproteobacteria bacterium]|nr:hypothetical protein [Deltaproteobacteria bacterium]